MRVVIAGGHGKIALLVERLVAERGDQAVGLIRNPNHAAEVRAAGAEAVVCDLEAAAAEDVSALVAGADAVVFAAGAGPGSGVARKDAVDRAAAVLMASAAEQAGVPQVRAGLLDGSRAAAAHSCPSAYCSRPGGFSDRPCPRRSNVTMRNVPARSPRTWFSQQRSLCDQP